METICFIITSLMLLPSIVIILILLYVFTEKWITRRIVFIIIHIKLTINKLKYYERIG